VFDFTTEIDEHYNIGVFLDEEKEDDVKELDVKM